MSQCVTMCELLSTYLVSLITNLSVFGTSVMVKPVTKLQIGVKKRIPAEDCPIKARKLEAQLLQIYICGLITPGIGFYEKIRW